MTKGEEQRDVQPADDHDAEEKDADCPCVGQRVQVVGSGEERVGAGVELRQPGARVSREFTSQRTG